MLNVASNMNRICHAIPQFHMAEKKTPQVERKQVGERRI